MSSALLRYLSQNYTYGAKFGILALLAVSSLVVSLLAIVFVLSLALKFMTKGSSEIEEESSQKRTSQSERGEEDIAPVKYSSLNNEEETIQDVSYVDPQKKNICKRKCICAAKWIMLILEVIIVVLLVLFASLLAAFNLFSSYLLAAVITWSLLMSFILFLWYLYNWVIGNYGKIYFSKARYVLIPAILLFCAIYASFIFWSGACLCILNDTLPGIQSGEYLFHTAFMRYYHSETCPVGDKPCLVYATLPENADQSVFINFHINADSCENRKCSPVLEYREYSSNSWQSIVPIQGEYESPPSEYSQRYIFTALLKDLSPKTLYEFRIQEPTWDEDSEQNVMYSYKTFDPENLKIVQGGDSGNTKEAIEMNQNSLKNINPDLVMIGGDIAYDNNIATCYQTWDYLLKNLLLQKFDEETNTHRVIPIIFATGNHDLGVDSYNNAIIPHNKHAPVFKHYFPQNTYEGKVPNIYQRKSYFSHKISDRILIITADMAYETKIEGEQAEWMEKILSEFENPINSGLPSFFKGSKIKLAQYHGPIYTSIKQGSQHDEEVIEKGLKYFTPLFDKYNVKIAFENHSHSFKRSKPIKNGVIDEEGTYYLGEGSWGVSKLGKVIIPQNTDLHETTSQGFSIWGLKIDSTNTIKATAYDTDYSIIDQLEIDI
ncbi:unnamed protein product [Moneuplotes crassus]|uniref:Calcineurin-like phosphoesterase domain-containing protein n=2 Tax=Euplotes crassus TaxID=5936 RepID=A0AAD1Y8V5_EUPCR|nr:unnamed protein product [Moneuplotes crassus]